MITKLVIGPTQLTREGNDSDEQGTSAISLEHPFEIAKWVRMIARRPEESVVCTTSPAVIHHVWALWCERDDQSFARVFLRTKKRDVALSDAFDEKWLAHFAIEDLYMRGEFDQILQS